MAHNDGNGQETKVTTSFTVDSDQSGIVDVPSVTKLLNRKSLGLSKSSPPKAPAASSPPPSFSPAPTRPAAPTPEPISPQPGGFALESTREIPTFGPSESPSSINLSPPEPVGAPSTPSVEITPSSGGAPGEISIEPSGGGISLQLETTQRPELELGNTTAPAAAEAPAPVQVQAPAPAPALEESFAPAQVQPAARRPGSRPIQALHSWSATQLASSPDPMARGIHEIFKKGAKQALFMAIQPPPPGSPVPVFGASAAVAMGDKEVLWNGLKWDPTVVPEMWNYFIKSGFVELSPPGALTNQNSNRNVVRAAFGIRQDEWITLVRVGPPEACRGVLAFVAPATLLEHLPGALKHFAAPMAPQKAA